TPRKITPRWWYRSHARSSTDASALHGSHHEAQKLSTTASPWSEASETFPVPSSRLRVNAGAFEPTLGGAGCPCASFQTSSASRPATHRSVTTWTPSLSLPVTPSPPRGGSARTSGRRDGR